MDITQLPSELLDLVFGQFANILLSDDPNLTLWKDVLPLVGVSRQWRALATRHVYKYLFIECHDEEEVVDEDEMDDTESIDQSSCLLPPLWLTNICLFQHNNINQYARNIIIYVDASISFSNFIFQTVDLLKLGTVTWSNLQYMDICVNTAIENPDNSADNNNDTMAQNLEQAASLLARHFTNIKHLRIFADKSHLSYKPTATFSNKLLNLTAKHLTSLITFLPTRLQLSTFTSQLTKLRLTFAHVDTCYIPHVFSDTLKELYINCAPRKFPWDCFTKTSGSQQITFVNLTALTIIFRPPEDTPLQELLSTVDCSAQVYMPKLTALRLEQCPVSFISMFHGRLPANLQLLHINGPVETLRYLQQLKVSHVRYFYVYMDPVDEHGEHSFYQVSNMMFGANSFITKKSWYSIFRISFPLDLKQVNWSTLTSLMFTPNIELDCLQMLIVHLHQLNYLHIVSLVFNTIDPPSVDNAVDINTTPLNKVNSNITSFVLESEHTNLMVQHGMLVMHSVVLRLPLLEKLTTTSEFEEFVNQLDTQWPCFQSLRNIEISSILFN